MGDSKMTWGYYSIQPEINSNSAKATKERKYIRAFDSGAASHEARAAAKAMEKWRGLVEWNLLEWILSPLI